MACSWESIRMFLTCGAPQDWRHYPSYNITTDAVAIESVSMKTNRNHLCAALCGKKEGCTVATVEGSNLCKLYDICPVQVALQTSPTVHTYIKGWTRPSGYSGPNPVLYLPFDHSSCITHHGTNLATGKIGRGLVASADRSWASLGKFPNRCFTQPGTCVHGVSVSFWFRVDDPNPTGGYGSILSSRSNNGGSNAGFCTWFDSTATYVYQIFYDTDKACNLYTISLPTPGWVHSVFTFRNGGPLIVYHNGIQV